MKPKKVSKKLNFKKVTISGLDTDQLSNVKGGVYTVTYYTACVTCDIYRCNPTYTSLPLNNCVDPND